MARLLLLACLAGSANGLPTERFSRSPAALANGAWRGNAATALSKANTSSAEASEVAAAPRKSLVRREAAEEPEQRQLEVENASDTGSKLSATDVIMENLKASASGRDAAHLRVDISSLPTFFSFDTKQRFLVRSVGNFPVELVTAGEGVAWKSFKTKLEGVHDFAKSRSATELIVLMDSDVFYGGCDLNEFMERYQFIVRSSGARVVSAAEMTCWENPCHDVPETPEWSRARSGVQDLENGFWKSFAQCSAHWIPENVTYGHCADPPVIKFLNSGFLMGPAADLASITKWSIDNFEQMTTYSDQGLLARYWLDHLNQVTLDYLGELVSCTSDINVDKMFEVRRGTLWNKAFNRTQCFMHANGDGKTSGVRLANQTRQSRT